jgi:hypothetical protein
MRYSLLLISLLLLSGCKTRDQYAATQLRNISEVAQSADTIGAARAVAVIKDIADTTAAKLDPAGSAKPVTTAAAIRANPEPELRKVYASASAGPGNWTMGLWSALGIGAMALGVVGKFLGGPWNIAGMGAQALAKRFLPDYDENKKVAASVIVSVDSMLAQYGSMLDASPELKAKLTEKLGQDPVAWAKAKLEDAHTDLGNAQQVAAFMDTLKAELTTNGSVLQPSAAELDAWLAKRV